MKLTIIPEDNVVTINGESYTNLNLSFLDQTIHAVQWYETYGEVEHKDPITGKMTSNREILNIDEFQQAIAVWQTAKDAANLAAQGTPIGGAPNVIA